MSHHAHGTRRNHDGASRTRQTETATPTHRFSYRDLHPEMYNQPPKLRNRRLTNDERRAAILADLRANGESSATEIARRIGFGKQYVMPLLVAGIDGVMVVRTRQIGGGTLRIWGISSDAK